MNEKVEVRQTLKENQLNIPQIVDYYVKDFFRQGSTQIKNYYSSKITSAIFKKVYNKLIEEHHLENREIKINNKLKILQLRHVTNYSQFY